MKKAILALALVAVFTGQASAVLVYWDLNGTGTTGAGTTPAGAWNTTTGVNWNKDSNGDATMGPLAAWVNNDTAVFSAGSDATGAFTVTATGTPVAAGVIIEEGTITLSGRADVNTGTIELKSGTTLVQASSGGATGTGFTVTAGGGYLISGNATLRQTNAANAGSFVATAATLAIANNSVLTLDYTATANPAPISIVQQAITGSGSIVKNGAGIIRMGIASTYSGSTTINAGELRLGGSATNRLPVGTDLIINGGILNMAASSQNQTVASLSGSGGSIGFGGATLTIDGPNSTTYSGLLLNTSFIPATTSAGTTGVGRIIKNGNGTLTLTNVNTITGSVTLNAGGITVNSGGSLGGDVMDLTVNGGTLTLNQAAETVENLAGTGGSIVLNNAALSLISDPVASTTYAGTISGAGGLTKANALSGTRRTLTLTGNNSYDGNTIVTGGLISVGHGSALGSTLGYTEVNPAVVLGAEILFTGAGGSVTTNEPFRLAGTGSLNGGAISVTAGATPTISGPVTLIGDTTLTVSGTSGVTYDNANAITSVANQNLTLAGGAGVGAGGLISGAINLGTGSLTKDQGGTWELAGANTYSGGTNVNAGVLLVSNTAGSGTGTGAVAVASGATIGGSGTIDGPLTVSGTVAPGGSIDTLTVTDNVILNPLSQLAYELTLGSPGQQPVGGSDNDLLAIVGGLTLGDATDGVVLNVDGSIETAQAGDRWTLITYSGGLTMAGPGIELGTMPELSDETLQYLIDFTQSGEIGLVVAQVVPEAGAFAAVGVVGLLSVGAVWIRKRMRPAVETA